MTDEPNNPNETVALVAALIELAMSGIYVDFSSLEVASQ